LAVVMLAGSFLTDSVNWDALGFDFVPAFEGEMEAVAVIEGAVWAYAIPATPTARVAAPAAMNVLRKVVSSRGDTGVRTRGRSWTARRMSTTRQQAKGFASSIAVFHAR
jgi:hypothetical protein